MTPAGSSRRRSSRRSAGAACSRAARATASRTTSQSANDHTLLIALIEDVRALQNLDEILAVDHIDVFFVAPSDLAASMGLIGKVADPKVQEAVETTLKRIMAAGRTAGTTLFGNQNGERYAAMGVRFLAASAQPWLAAGVADLKRRIAAAAPG